MSNTTAPRATVDFSGASRETARAYAAEANSRILSDKAQATLKKVTAGDKVDAYDLNEAVTEAMRSTATRLGQSMARRALGTKVAYLGHIVQAVLESAADDLPTFEDGVARSRKVEELSQEVRHAGSVIRSLSSDLIAKRVHVRALQSEIDRLRAEIDSNAAKVAEVEAERDEVAIVLAYVFDALEPADKARVIGFWDGLIVEK